MCVYVYIGVHMHVWVCIYVCGSEWYLTAPLVTHLGDTLLGVYICIYRCAYVWVGVYLCVCVRVVFDAPSCHAPWGYRAGCVYMYI